MARFLLGDELGHIKSLRYTSDTSQDKLSLKVVYNPKQPIAVQGLAVSPSNDDASTILTAAFSDGSTSAFHLDDHDTLELISTWKEPRLKEQQKFIGLAASARTVFTCTSNGALRRVTLPEQDLPVSSQTAVLPARLRAWKLSEDGTRFAYGGDEVDISIWSTELTFQASKEAVASEEESSNKKRKRSDNFLPAELWRAKNIANDGLGLRQPVRITSLTLLDPTPNSTHLLAGTELGDARRYDVRVSRRPVAEFKAIGRVGGVKAIEKGANENEVFLSDNGSNLFSIDLRNGKIAYGYKGLSGSVNSIATAPKMLATTALDRFARIHSVFPLPKQVGQQQDQRGQILEKVFTKSIPTSVVWDGHLPAMLPLPNDEDGDDDDIWENMQHVDDEF
ncbi:hypothetical protein APHAL10511_001217 [Amanita phalloides]|nr:hypothetical protein APHAL10511_001217 [Amanita phalloides]